MLLQLVAILFILILVKHLWSRKSLYKLACKLPGPVALPLIGNGLLFAGDSSDSYDVIVKCVNKYSHPMRIWMGPKLLVVYSKVEHVEKLFPSTKLIEKSDIYRFINDYVEFNAISGSGPIWREQRRLIQHIISTKYTFSNLSAAQTHIDELLRILKTRANGNDVDLLKIIHYCIFDILFELVFGINTNTQKTGHSPLFDDIMEVVDIIWMRMTKPWFQIDSIFNATEMKKTFDRCKATVQQFAITAIEEASRRIEAKSEIKPTDPVVDHVLNYARDNPDTFTTQQIIDLTLTVILASVDTITTVAASTCTCLGMNQDYQKIAVKEIKNSLRENQHGFNGEELNSLKYVDMCVKEALRLFPIAPFILRKSSEELLIDDLVIPSGTDIFLSIYNLHRNPKHWKNPNHFYPDNFLPDAVNNRHKYAYVPFSSGPRSCSGSIFGAALSKLVVANILNNFELESKGDVPDIRLSIEVTLRFRNGLMLKLKERK